MTLPLLSYPTSSQNQRVAGYEVPGDEQPRVYSTDNIPTGGEMDELIRAAYRQVFHEQQILQCNRQIDLESQLRNGQISVREFIRGLATSEVFRSRSYEPSNNYRFAQMCVQRLLGREVYNEREKFAWSIVLATKGLQGFIDALVNSEEYLSQFGDDTVPYQRRRIIPQRSLGDLPFERMPRYGADHRATLESLGYFAHEAKDYPWSKRSYQCPPPRWAWQKQPTPANLRIWTTLVNVGGILLAIGTLAIALSAWGIIDL
ncbi:MAG: phycobilisome rod-core linker polypeptide [Cyanobacteria bacterium SID2]|nr:phycobilisome rod-core linker polypeptide [Cyanobacteria bacterium SID2]MBP0005863.1 phycobilisome rod-core linker polypeptide [Cyanobacteria bacterium SBC]